MRRVLYFLLFLPLMLSGCIAPGWIAVVVVAGLVGASQGVGCSKTPVSDYCLFK